MITAVTDTVESPQAIDTASLPIDLLLDIVPAHGYNPQVRRRRLRRV